MEYIDKTNKFVWIVIEIFIKIQGLKSNWNFHENTRFVLKYKEYLKYLKINKSNTS